MAYEYRFIRVSFPRPFVAHVELNRPEKLNAIFLEMSQELGSVFAQLSTDPSVRAIVLSGAGDRAFSAGLDLQKAGENLFKDRSLDIGRESVSRRRIVEGLQADVGAISKCEKPVIGVFHGHSIGFAVDIACAADVRIAAADVRFAVKEVDIGMAADVGTLTRLPKIVGSHSWVKDVCLTGRTFGAEEAARVGFVSTTAKSKAEALEVAIGMAVSIGEKSPIAVVGTKRLIGYSVDHAVDDGLHYTAVWNSAMLQSEDFLKAAQASMSKTRAEFAKL